MSKEYDHFWKYHNKDNMDVHAVKLIEVQAERITELETVIRKCIDAMKGSNCLEQQWLEKALKGSK